MINNDLHWLSGILEGEGSFTKGPPCRPVRISISMMSTDEDIVQRVAKLLEAPYWLVLEKRRIKNPHWKPVYSTRKSGLKALEIMKELKPLMGKRRQSQITIAEAAFAEHAQRRDYLTENTILSIIEDNKLGTLTQKQVGVKYGLTRETINKICNGKSNKWKHLLEL